MENNALPATRPFRCDCVKLKRAIQAQIYEETKYMTPEEQRERLRKNSEEFWADIERRRKKLAECQTAKNQT